VAGGSAVRTGSRRAGRAGSKTQTRAPALSLAERRREILARLAHTYADARTALAYGDPYELLVAVILSAQCTDARVNMVTPDLFRAFPTVRSMSRAAARQVEPFVKSCGLFATKAKNIVAASKMIVDRFDGDVPKTMDELLALPGVGRKTANVILSVAFDQDAIAVDTHVFRVANRLGLVRAKTPRAVELQLQKVVPRAQWSDAHHWLIHHGRRICHARKPECERCPLVDLCPSAKKFLRPTSRR
jgi:endonuclease-3